MGDLLIKNIPEAIRQSLEERAERAGTSLSEEVTAILHREFANGLPPIAEPAGHRLRSLMVDEASWTDEDLAVIESARHAPDRAPPRFDE